MRIKAIDPIRDIDDGRAVNMEAGDILTVSDKFGAYACEMGWAEDVDGEVPTGERRTGPVTVTPERLVTKPSQK